MGQRPDQLFLSGLQQTVLQQTVLASFFPFASALVSHLLAMA